MLFIIDRRIQKLQSRSSSAGRLSSANPSELAARFLRQHRLREMGGNLS